MGCHENVTALLLPAQDEGTTNTAWPWENRPTYSTHNDRLHGELRRLLEQSTYKPETVSAAATYITTWPTSTGRPLYHRSPVSSVCGTVCFCHFLLFLSLCKSHARARTHTYTRAGALSFSLTHTATLTHTHTPSLSNTHTHCYSNTHTLPSLSQTHTHCYSNSHTLPLSQTHTHTQLL